MKITIQTAVLNSAYDTFKGFEMERIKEEFIKRIQEIPTEDLVTIEDRESCKWLKITAEIN